MKLKKYSLIGFLCVLMLFPSSCIKEDMELRDAYVNYDVLWNTLNERYCFFEYKDINWDSLYPVYRAKIANASTSDEIFYIYCDLMANLKDGHVNLSSAGDFGRYWEWFEDYPTNFSQDVLNKYYLGKDYRIASGFNYKKFDSIGYIRYESFSFGVGNGNISAVFSHFQNCKGLIIDVRDNGGGNLLNVNTIASRFTKKSILYGYLQHKTGAAHDAFSKPVPQSLDPNLDYSIWEKPVVVLTNRGCYSATNNFVCIMELLDNVTVMGDKTGGGGGMPHSSELPIGWVFRYSAIPMLDRDLNHIENGIEPDIYIAMDTVALKRGVDSMIEEAIDFLEK